MTSRTDTGVVQSSDVAGARAVLGPGHREALVPVVGEKLVTGPAFALVATRGILADVITTSVFDLAFVDVCDGD